jgi:hypothetical protein
MRPKRLQRRLKKLNAPVEEKTLPPTPAAATDEEETAPHSLTLDLSTG